MHSKRVLPEPLRGICGFFALPRRAQPMLRVYSHRCAV
jgi:hypothetical protein